jgi:chromate reductase
MHILIISGSLRKDSYNTILANTLKSTIENQDHTASVATLHDIPFFNQDTEESAIPDSVSSLTEEIQKADRVVIVTPEYNKHIPGVLANTLDWLSRKSTGKTLYKKTVATAGASPSGFGTYGAQTHLESYLVCLGAQILGPRLHISAAHEKIIDGAIQDQTTQASIEKFTRTIAE